MKSPLTLRSRQPAFRGAGRHGPLRARCRSGGVGPLCRWCGQWTCFRCRGSLPKSGAVLATGIPTRGRWLLKNEMVGQSSRPEAEMITSTMTSNRGSAAERRFVSLDMATFRVIFQLTKELPNLPQGGLAEAGLTGSYADEILQFARALRIEARRTPWSGYSWTMFRRCSSLVDYCPLVRYQTGWVRKRVMQSCRGFLSIGGSHLSGRLRDGLTGASCFCVGEVAAAIRAFSAERNEVL
jgi:hypothetical protein